MKNNSETYTLIRLSNAMMGHIDQFIEKNPIFSTRTDFVKHCIRFYIENNNGGIDKNYQKEVNVRKDGGEDEVKKI